MLVAVVILLGATGCSALVNGITGITVDRDGNLRISLSWCGRDPSVVRIYHHDQRSRKAAEGADATPTYDTVGEIVYDARYKAPSIIIGNSTSFRIDEPDNGWRTEQKPAALDPDITYYASGGARYVTTREVAFRLEHLEELTRRPGTVLVLGDYEKPEFITQSEFERRGSVDHCPD